MCSMILYTSGACTRVVGSCFFYGIDSWNVIPVDRGYNIWFKDYVYSGAKKSNSYSQKGRSVWFHSHLTFCTCTSNCLTIVWRYWWVHQLVYILYACPLVIIEPDRVYEPWSIIRVLKYKPAYIIKHSNPRRRSLSLQKETTATNVRTYW